MIMLTVFPRWWKILTTQLVAVSLHALRRYPKDSSFNMGKIYNEIIGAENYTRFFRNYKDAAVIIKQAGAVVHNMSAVVVYLAEVNEVTHLEVAQYTIEQFLSDVGGAAGLFMGMSLATVLGTCDFIFLMIYESVQRTDFYKRIRDIITRRPNGNTAEINRKWTRTV